MRHRPDRHLHISGTRRRQAGAQASANDPAAWSHRTPRSHGSRSEKKRLFVAAVANNTLEVVDLTRGRVIKSLAGFKDTQDALFLGGDFNKLYVSSLDGHVRVFQGESFWLVQDFKVEPDPNRLFYDSATNLIYFGYGGQNAGFDSYIRVGILHPKSGAGFD